MKNNILKSIIISVILLMGVSNAWAYVTYYLKSSNTTWNTNTYDWGFTHGTTTTTYMDNNSEFKLWRTDWGQDGWFGQGNNTTINLKENDHDGVQLQQWTDGGNVKYVGPSGMVCFHMDQNDGKEDKPWVWITRPTFYLKHNWSGGEWTWKALTDNQDGTYQLTDYYGGKGVNYGDNNSSQDGWGYVTATTTGTLSTGKKCIFVFNSANKTIAITRLYTITYNGNGHTGGTVPAAIDKKHGTSITLSSSTPTRTGYTFAGWNTKQDGTGTTYAKGATYSTNADVTLYAQWEIREDKISLWTDSYGGFEFDANGKLIMGKTYELYIQYGTNTFYTKDTQGNKTYVTVPMPYHRSPSKYCTGYTIGGGSKLLIDKYGKLCKGVANGGSYTDNNGNWVYTGNTVQTTATAKYSDSYPVDLDANSGTWTANGEKVTYVVYNQIVPDITGEGSLPWKTGYTFNGYYVNADGTGDKYYDKDGKGLLTWTFSNTAANIIEKLYANYTPTVYNITYDNLGDATHTNPATYTIETPTISFAAPTKDRTGYTFKNWSPSSIAKGSTNNKTITAQWTANTYTVTLNQQSGTGGTTSVTATYDAAMPAITKPTRNGYTFGGYYTATNGGGTQYYNANGASSKNWDKTAATTLYAKWTANQYTITWNANGGTVTPASSTYTYDGDPVALPTPTRTGYEFNGWFTAPTGGTRISDVGKTNKPTSNTTYYAQWKAKTYIVTLDPQGGFSGSNSINATYDATLPAITPPTRDGYIFEGYYSEPNGQGKKYYNADGSSANLWDKENATLYAKWVEYAKCIFFKNNVSWSNVYVYTFSEEVWHNGNDQNDPNDDKGVQPKTNRIEFGQMTKLGETDVYYYILTNTTTGFNRIAFSNADMSGYNEFYQNQAVYRGDRTDQMPLFVPYKGASKTANSTTYYNEGVWMKYNSKESGYYLNIAGDCSLPFTAPTVGDYTFTATAYLTGDKQLDVTNLRADTKFADRNYMTANSCTGWNLALWDWDSPSTWGINITEEGAYTFTLNLANGQVNVSATYPTSIALAEGDFRLIYVEQVVEKDKNRHTIITRKKTHPSDIIKKRADTTVDSVSLHVYNQNTYQAIKKYNGETPITYESPSNSEVILQKYTGGKWVDVEHHMVFGRLATIPEAGMLPERRDAVSEDPLIEQLRLDPGITNIIEDTHKFKGNGVWNFPVRQDGNGNATLERNGVKRYSGKYYIRTVNAKGGWFEYKNTDNHMSYSAYAEGNNEFSYYYCQWIDLAKNSSYVQFVVANDFGKAISDTLTADKTTLLGNPLDNDQIMVGSNGILPESANIRFSWKEWSNALHRAYIGGSGEGDADYLVLHDASGDAEHHLYQFSTPANRLTNNKQTFSDNAGWMYQADVYAQTLAPVKLTAKYPLNNHPKTQYFKGTATATAPLIGGNAGDTEKYPIRILYDFKENRLITAYVPQAPETNDVAISTDLMIIRKDHQQANQLTLNQGQKHAVNAGQTAYGAITFTKEHLSSNNWAAANDKTFYWISFPFDVKLSDAFGFGKYAVHWYIEWYDGESRAKNGLFLDSGTYWKYVTKSEAKDFELKANTGYVLWLNVPRIQSDNFFVGETNEISIYFPSKNPINAQFAQYENQDYTVKEHWRPEGSRRYNEDSNWNLIGVPSYANSTIKTELANGIKPAFLYTYLPATDTYSPTAADSQNFQSMYAYMVQFAGTITWTQLINDHNPIPASIAARQSSTEDMPQQMLRLELRQNGKYADQTFVKLQAEDATYNFDMNKDLTKVINKTPNLYSITSDNVDVAGNVMPLAETIVPLGVDLQAAGEYTFAMPDGTEGIVTELIDYQTNTRTNLLLDNYTVTLPAGINETRFALMVKPDKVATSVENIGEAGNDGEAVRKYLIDGKLYLQKDGALYDAQGHIVR